MEFKDLYNILDYNKNVMVSCYNEDNITDKKERIELKSIPDYMTQMPDKLSKYILGRSVEIPAKIWTAEVRQITEDYGKILVSVTARTDTE